jgi:hypothetical protein
MEKDLSKMAVLISRILDIRDYASGKQFPMWSDEERLALVKEELDKLANELNDDEDLIIV